MIIVSDTSVISGLLVIGRLDILEKVCGKVIIPKIVHEELLVLESYGYDLRPIQGTDWLEIVEPSNKQLEDELNQILDRGESSAIALAKELRPKYLAIDEKKGREVAESLGLPIIGLIGIIILAKEQGYTPKVKSILDKLIQEAGFRISPKFYQFILTQVNE